LRTAVTAAAFERRIGPRARDLLAELAPFREFLNQSSLSEVERNAFLEGRAWMHVGELISEVQRIESVLRKA